MTANQFDVYDIDTANPKGAVKVAETTLLVCSECGQGNYATDGFGLWECTTATCDHAIGWHDVTPEADEYVTDVCGLLAVATTTS